MGVKAIYFFLPVIILVYFFIKMHYPRQYMWERVSPKFYLRSLSG